MHSSYAYGTAARTWLAAAAATLLAFASAAHGELDRKLVSTVSASTFEVVVLKPVKDSLTYERALPLHLIPYNVRNDKYYSVGTAFAIAPGTWVTAAHVLALGQESQDKVYRLRDRQGKVYDIDRITRYSWRRDFVEFTVRDDPGVPPLPANTAPALNEKVYTVGNALGEGVVFRDGLFTSETPEEQDGEWKWIRFSAAASPGNSGGPLLDTQGRVIGIVVRKSENENLNFALPIGEFLAAKRGVADLDIKMMYAIDNMANMTSSDRLRQQFGLPKTYAALDQEMTAALSRFGVKLKEDLFREHAAQIFPKGDGSLPLLHTSYSAVVPGLVSRRADGRWDAFFPQKTQSGDLGANGRMTFGAFGASLFVHFEKPDNVKLGALYSDSRLMMDLLLRGNPLYRSIGSENVKIVSMGKAAEEGEHVDAYGRKWLVRIWNVEFSDQRVALFALPVPGGYAAMIRRTATSRMDSHLVDLRALTDFFYLSYYGTFEQWREFLAERSRLPAAFADIRIDIDYGKQFAYTSRRLRFAYGPEDLRITPQSDLRLQFSYFGDGPRTVWDVAQVVAGDNRDNSTFFAVARNVHPSDSLDAKHKNRWDAIVNRRHPYNKSAYTDDKRTLIGEVHARGIPSEKLVEAPLLYTAFYSADGNIEPASIASKLDRFLEKLTIRE